jgi:hypothetical protein
MINLSFDSGIIRDAARDYQTFFIIFISGSGIAYIGSALLFSYIFKRRLAFTMAVL